MKTNKHLIILALLTFICSKAFSQTYQQLPSGEKVNGAQVYILPKAAFTIEFYKIKREYIKGDDSHYDLTPAELALVIKKYGVDPDIYAKLKAVVAPATTATIYSIPQDSIKLAVSALPDFTKIFYTYPKKKWNVSQSTTFTYGSDGIITDAEATYENRTADIIFKGISTLSAVAASFKGAPAVAPNPKTDIKELDDILDKYGMLKNQFSFDIYKDLKSTLEKQYAAIFAEKFYRVKTTITPVKIVYCPSPLGGAATTATFDLFGMTASGTLEYNSNLGTDIVWVKNITGASSVTSPYKIKFSLLNTIYQQKDFYRTTPALNSYFGYNIAAKTLVSIITPAVAPATPDEILLDVYKVPQFGSVAYVNAKKVKITFQLDPMTGELKKLSTETKAITDDQIDNAGTAATNAITTIKGDDADTKLDKEVKRLENEKKKKDLLKELSETP